MTETTAPLDPASIMAEHAEAGSGGGWCIPCGRDWPCLPYRLAAELIAALKRRDETNRWAGKQRDDRHDEYQASEGYRLRASAERDELADELAAALDRESRVRELCGRQWGEKGELARDIVNTLGDKDSGNWSRMASTVRHPVDQ